MRQRDSRLFYLSMEVTVRKAGAKRTERLSLDDDARPAILQQCHPKGDSRYASENFNQLLSILISRNFYLINKCFFI